MTTVEIDWLIRVKRFNTTYKIVVDNDCIWIDDIKEDECVFTFNYYGQDFIVELLNELGYNAEHC